jgi:endonuclease YncB( thermonuclease family)
LPQTGEDQTLRLSRKSRTTPYRPPPIPPPSADGPSFDLGEASGEPSGFGAEADDDIGPLAPRRTRIALPAAIVVGVIAVGIGAVMLAGGVRWLPGATRPAVQPTASDIAESKPVREATPRRALTSRAWALWHDLAYDPLNADTLEAQRAFQAPRSFPPGFDIIEGATLQSEQTRIRLSYIASLAPGAICQSDLATKFACGLMARASLSILASGSKLLCYPDVSLDTETPRFICYARGRDLALAQIEAGYALPATHSVPVLEKLTEEARARRIGAWKGDWILLPPGGEAVPTASAPQ